MTLPGWLPRWLVRILDLMFGGESVPVLECSICGALIDMPEDADEMQYDVAYDRHYRFFHGDAA